MDNKSLIEARVRTRDLVVQVLKEFLFSVIALVGASTLTLLMFPEVVPKMVILVFSLFGFSAGTIIGALRAYNIFWDKMEVKKE